MKHKKQIKCGIFAGAALMAFLFSASLRAEIVTWTFRATINYVRQGGPGSGPPGGGFTDVNGTLPVGAPVVCRYTFDTAVPGAPSDPQWNYLLDSTHFAETCTFGPYTFSTTASSLGNFNVTDRDSSPVSNSLFAWGYDLTQTAGAPFPVGGCTASPLASVQ